MAQRRLLPLFNDIQEAAPTSPSPSPASPSPSPAPTSPSLSPAPTSPSLSPTPASPCPSPAPASPSLSPTPASPCPSPAPAAAVLYPAPASLSLHPSPASLSLHPAPVSPSLRLVPVSPSLCTALASPSLQSASPSLILVPVSPSLQPAPASLSSHSASTSPSLHSAPASPSLRPSSAYLSQQPIVASLSPCRAPTSSSLCLVRASPSPGQFTAPLPIRSKPASPARHLVLASPTLRSLPGSPIRCVVPPSPSLPSSLSVTKPSPSVPPVNAATTRLQDADSEATVSAFSCVNRMNSDVGEKNKCLVYYVKKQLVSVNKAVRILKNVNEQKVSTVPPVNPTHGEVYVYKYTAKKRNNEWGDEGIVWTKIVTRQLDLPAGSVTAGYFRVERNGKHLKKRVYKLSESPYFLVNYSESKNPYVLQPKGKSTVGNNVDISTASQALRTIRGQQTHHKLIDESQRNVPDNTYTVTDTVKKAHLMNVQNPNDVLATYILCEQLKDFVLDMRVYPDMLITMALPEMFKELKAIMGNIISPKTHVLHYDTTFDLGDFNVSPLVFRHEIFEEAPSIPLAFLIHKSRTVRVHAAFLKEIKQHVPEINSPRFVVCTDCELAIEDAVHSVLPQSATVNCWNHILQSVKRQVRDMRGEEDDVEVYVENIREILECETRDLMERKIAALSVTWSQPFLEYFQTYLNESLISSARFALKNLGLTLPSITNNVAESFNATIKRMIDGKGGRLERIVFSLFHLQNYCLNEILQGRCNSGNYHLKDPGLSSNFEETTFPTDVLTLEEIERLHKDDKNITEPKVTKEDNEKLTNSQQAMAERIISENKISLDAKTKSFIITDWKGQKYLTSLAPDEKCSCSSTSQCYHIIAARLAVGYQKEKPQPTTLCLKKLVRKEKRKRR